MSTGPYGELGLKLRFEGDHTVMGVAGDLDALTAATFGAALTSLLDEGYTHLVLDLADLEFIGAAGAWAITKLATRLEAIGVVLTLRSVPSFASRVLHITRVSELVKFEASTPPLSGVGRPARIGAVPRNTAVIDAALQMMTVLATATVVGADGASVTLRRNGVLVTAAANNDTVLRMDTHQYHTGQGPCLTAATEGTQVLSASLAEEERWADFVPLAMGEGIASILSTPLVVAGRPVGALNIYSLTERAFTSEQSETATLFAEQASGMVDRHGGEPGNAVDHPEDDARIADALSAREVIAQAQGVLMARQAISAARAAATLHSAARVAHLPVRRYASDVVASTLTGTEDGGDG